MAGGINYPTACWTIAMGPKPTATHQQAPEIEFVQEVLAQLPWYHQLTLLDKLKTRKDREWYALSR